jgi:hypothetical protein
MKASFAGRLLGAIGVLLAALLLASAAALAASVLNGGTINKVSVAQGEDNVSTQSTTFQDIPGASTHVSIPSGEKGLILARFNAESDCQGPSNAAGDCLARILAVNNSNGAVVQLPPGLSGDVSALDSSDPFGSFAYHTMDRAVILPSGSYTVKVQWRILSPVTGWTLDDYSLTVEKARA